jgi:hypothetical protein
MVAMSALTFGRVGTLVEYSTTVGSSLITELRHNEPPTQQFVSGLQHEPSGLLVVCSSQNGDVGQQVCQVGECQPSGVRSL